MKERKKGHIYCDKAQWRQDCVKDRTEEKSRRAHKDFWGRGELPIVGLW